MAVIEEASRKPSYYNDIETYGKFGESVFLERMAKEDKNVFDVRGEKEWQLVDVDFIVAPDDITELPDFEQIINDNRFIKIEVKLDTRAMSTGNLPYEVISHGSLGWCSVTKCDLVYYVLTNREGNEVLKTIWVDMRKWSDYCSERRENKKINHLTREGIVDLLCNMEKMKEYGAIKQ